MRRQLRFEIPRDRDGTPLLDFLAARFPYHARSGWADALASGQLLINGRCVRSDDRLAAGDVMEYLAPDIPEPPVNPAWTALYEDRDLLVVDKPPNLPCHPGGRYFNHTLWALLKTGYGLPDPILVNRLDRETSGIVLVAKTPDAGRRCRAEFSRRGVEKRYIALVEGDFPETAAARGFIRGDTSSPVRKMQTFEPVSAEAAPAEPDSAWAETRFHRLSLRNGLSEVEAVPLTGRTHQIRVTLKAMGFPVVGDKLYGVDPELFLRFCRGELTSDDERRLRLPRQALHAAGLRMTHPRTGKPVEFMSPLPEDMAALMR